jgi:hypothetical protein
VFLPLAFIISLALGLIARVVMTIWNLLRDRRVEEPETPCQGTWADSRSPY